MLADQVVGLRGRRLRQRFDQAGVDVGGPARNLGQQFVGGMVKTVPHDMRERLVKHRAAGLLHEQVVKFHLRPPVGQRPHLRRVEFTGHLEEFFFGLADRLAGIEAGRLHLERLPNVESPERLRCRDRLDDRATAGACLEKTLPLQLRHRLEHGHNAHAQIGRHLPAVEPVAGREPIGEHRFVELLVDAVREECGLHRRCQDRLKNIAWPVSRGCAVAGRLATGSGK